MSNVASLSASAALEKSIRAKGLQASAMLLQIPGLVRSLEAAGISQIPSDGITAAEVSLVSGQPQR